MISAGILVLFIGAVIAIQLRSGNSLVWFGGWHTRANNPALFWVWVCAEALVLCGALLMLFGAIARGN
jgi:hypothetical protein